MGSDKLVQIPFNEMPKLRDLYKTDWPKYHLPYNTIDIFYSWFQQNPEIENLTVYSLNGDWSDGTYIIIERNHVYCCTLNENFDNLIRALKCLDLLESYFLYGCVSYITLGLKKFFNEIGFKYEFIEPGTITDWLCLPKEDALKFEVRVPEGLVLKQIREEDVDTVNEVWPHKHSGSEKFIRRLIKYNPSIGLFDELTGAILAWCLKTPIGSLGLLQVKDSEMRKGYGSLVMRAFSKKLAEEGNDIYSPIVQQNTASLNLFNKYGFKKIDKLYWIDMASTISSSTDYKDDE